MDPWADDDVLECETCGRVLKTLTPDEAQKVAENPYNYIVFCASCQKANERMAFLHEY